MAVPRAPRAASFPTRSCKSGDVFSPDGRYGELFYLLHNGTIFAPSFMNLKRVPAMHGFDPAEPDSKACWLTTHPVDPAAAKASTKFLASWNARQISCRAARPPYNGTGNAGCARMSLDARAASGFSARLDARPRRRAARVRQRDHVALVIRA